MTLRFKLGHNGGIGIVRFRAGIIPNGDVALGMFERVSGRSEGRLYVGEELVAVLNGFGQRGVMQFRKTGRARAQEDLQRGELLAQLQQVRENGTEFAERMKQIRDFILKRLRVWKTG